jgi:transmembrane sensor
MGLNVRPSGGMPGTAPPDIRARPIPVRAGEVLVFAAGSAGPPTPHTARASDRQWVTGTKSFDDVSVTEIIAEANRYGHKRLVLADPLLGQRRVFAEIDIREIDHVAAALASFLKLDVDATEPGRITLRSRGVQTRRE